MQMRELIGKNIKTVVMITIFHMFEKREERLNMLRDMGDIKKVQTELLEAKIAMSEMKNTPGKMKRSDIAKEKINVPDYSK